MTSPAQTSPGLFLSSQPAGARHLILDGLHHRRPTLPHPRPSPLPDHLQPLAFLLEVERRGAAVAQGLGGDEVVEDGLADEAAVVVRDLAAGTRAQLRLWWKTRKNAEEQAAAD